VPNVRIGFGEVVSDIVKAIPHSTDAVNIVRGLASAARTNWVQMAQAKLNTSSRDYVQGISQPEEIRPGVMEITLLGRVPNMIEQGWPGPRDLRMTVIPNARTKHTSKEGHTYVFVPFRHGSPSSSGKNVGRRMPKEIYQVAKHLTARISHRGKGTLQQGGRLFEGMTHVGSKQVSQAARELLQVKVQPWHSTSLYTGMVREQKTYQKATQSSYTTWRTISTNPDAQTDQRKWQHPGIPARHFVKEVQDGLATSLQKILPLLAKR